MEPRNRQKRPEADGLVSHGLHTPAEETLESFLIQNSGYHGKVLGVRVVAEGPGVRTARAGGFELETRQMEDAEHRQEGVLQRVNFDSPENLEFERPASSEAGSWCRSKVGSSDYFEIRSARDLVLGAWKHPAQRCESSHAVRSHLSQGYLLSCL